MLAFASRWPSGRAIINAAKSLRVEKEIGRLDKGKAADIVFIEDNPLEDLAALKEIVMTVQGGRLVFEKQRPGK